MKPIVFPFFDDAKLANSICELSNFDLGKVILHQFPDKETLVCIETDVSGRSLIFMAGLDRPNYKILPILYAAEVARELGAEDIILLAPYLPYMRQDFSFHVGEAVSSRYFAALISDYFDWLVTIDPHLHRWHMLNEIYTIPNTVLHAGQSIAEWIVTHIDNPIIVGPDRESEQWVAGIAKFNDAPYLIADKKRHGDRKVTIEIPKLEKYVDHTPIIVDDIISTAKTMIAAVNHVTQAGLQTPICIGVHAIFVDGAYEELQRTGAKIITCNTVAHASNQIDLSPLMADLLNSQLFDYT